MANQKSSIKHVNEEDYSITLLLIDSSTNIKRSNLFLNKQFILNYLFSDQGKFQLINNGSLFQFAYHKQVLAHPSKYYFVIRNFKL